MKFVVAVPVMVLFAWVLAITVRQLQAGELRGCCTINRTTSPKLFGTTELVVAGWCLEMLATLTHWLITN